MSDITITEELLPTPSELHAQLREDVFYATKVATGVGVNVKEGSELWYRLKAFSDRMSVAFANGQLRLSQLSPYRAQGQDLLDLAAFWGITARPASKSSGFGTIALEPGYSSVTIPVGFKASSPTGARFETTAAYAGAVAGDTVAIEATVAGANDVQPGEVLTWDSAAVAGLKPSLTVTASGIDGGRDEDDVETVRARLLRKLAFPATGGNWAQVAELAEEASAAVVRAFVYPTSRGPGSYDVAILGDDDDPILDTTTQQLVSNHIAANMPGDGTATDAINVTSVALEPLDVVIDIAVPYPTLAGGVGGGFVSATPWPSDAETGPNVWAEVTDVGPDWIEVNSTSADPPKDGDRFGVWNDTSEEMLEFSAVSVGGSSGAYVITVDSNQVSKLSQVAVGARCSAWMEHIATYASSFVAAVKELGPGEKTDDVDILRYARRRPAPDVEWPYALTSTALAAITNSRSEVFDISYASRTETGTTTTRTTPSVPATVADAPNKLTVANLSFRAKS